MPVLDYFSSFFRREDGHIAATANHVSSLDEHEHSIADVGLLLMARRRARTWIRTRSMHPIDRMATSKPLVDLTKDSMAPVLPSLAEICVIDAMAARLALVERLESVYTASELPRRLI